MVLNEEEVILRPRCIDTVKYVKDRLKQITQLLEVYLNKFKLF